MNLLKERMEQQRQRVNIIDLKQLIIQSNDSNGYQQIIEATYNSNQQLIQQQDQQLQIQQLMRSQQQQQEQQQSFKQLRKEQSQPQQLQQSGQHLLIVNFQLLQLQPLITLNQQVNLFTLYLGLDSTIRVNLKLSKLFDLQSVNYFIQIDSILCKVNQQNSELFIKPYTKVNTLQSKCSQQLNNNALRHKVQMIFVMNENLSIVNGTIITLISNSDKVKWSFQIEKFTVGYNVSEVKENTKNRFSDQMQKPILMNLSVDGDYSYPLIDRLELPQGLDTVDKLRKCIDKLEPYQSPQIHLEQSSQQKQLFICHDMKGGYVQDINSFYPFMVSNKNKAQSYRFNYLSQTKIFNYFSHHPITIPPKMWRQLCKQYNTLCLGTFITQPNDCMIDEDDYVTKQFALKLVYIAKMVGFDGYLINIEAPVRNVKRLIEWLQFLTKEMNTAIPGSQIIWYDSIIISTGEIRYQNELNQLNFPFYQSTNGIFTNYWWNEQSLINSMKYKIKQKSIYIGNDCWGRNTYGGGKYDIYKAVNKIQQLGKGQLSVALFAPGFTYQDNAESSIQTFTQNELKMYHGFNGVSKPTSKWNITMNGGQGWKQQGEWAVTSYHLCKREVLVDMKQFQGKSQVLAISFLCIVAGTGPNFSDYYKITLQLYNYVNEMVYHEEIYQKTVATEQENRVEIRMEIDCEVITDGVCLRVIQEGNDVENWAGNFGSRFKGETILLSIQSKIKNWISTIPIQPVRIAKNQPYITYFNKGQGSKFYYMGNPIQKDYDFLSDYDIPPVFSLNNPSDVEIQYEEGFVGGSCLRFRNTNKIYLNRLIVKVDQEQKVREVFVKITVKETNLEFLSYGQGSKYIIKPNSQLKTINQWKTYTFQLNLLKQDRQFDIQASFTNSSGLIGEFSIFGKNKKDQLNNTVQLPFIIQIAASKRSKYIFPYCVDIMVISSTLPNDPIQLPKRFLMRIGQFSGFVYLQQSKKQQTSSNVESQKLKGFIQQISIIKQKATSFQIQIVDINNIESKVIMNTTVDWKDIKKLAQNNMLSYPFTWNSRAK